MSRCCDGQPGNVGVESIKEQQDYANAFKWGIWGRASNRTLGGGFHLSDLAGSWNGTMVGSVAKMKGKNSDKGEGARGGIKKRKARQKARCSTGEGNQQEVFADAQLLKG
jgi:hypothetical protein